MAKGNKKADDKSKKDTKAVGGKGKGGKGGATEQKAAPVKGAQSAKIRHILVCCVPLRRVTVSERLTGKLLDSSVRQVLEKGRSSRPAHFQ